MLSHLIGSKSFCYILSVSLHVGDLCSWLVNRLVMKLVKSSHYTVRIQLCNYVLIPMCVKCMELLIRTGNTAFTQSYSFT